MAHTEEQISPIPTKWNLEQASGKL